MTIKLYVDSYLPDNSFGIATSKRRVQHNLRIISEVAENPAPMFTIGRYVCMLFASDDKIPFTILFMDLKQNPGLISAMLGNAADKNLKNQHGSFLEAYNANYDSNVDEAELVLGDPPVSR